MPTRPEIISTVLSLSRAGNILNVEIKTAEDDSNISPWVINILVTANVPSGEQGEDEKYDLRVRITQALAPMRAAGTEHVVYVLAPGDQVFFGEVKVGQAEMVRVFNTPEEVMLEFGGGNPPPAWPQRSRFNALAEELTAEVRPLTKPDPRQKQPPRAPQLFESVIQVKERKLSPCPNCNTNAFEPNKDKTRVICRGCPLPSPIFAVDHADNWGFTTSTYKCSSCNRDSQVTMVLSDINLYCGGCGKLAVHTRQEQKLTVKAATRRAADAILKFGDKIIGPVSSVSIAEVPYTVSEWPDEISNEALKESLEQFKQNPPPNDWAQAIEMMQQTVAGAYGVPEELLNSSPAYQLQEMFRVKLGLLPYATFAVQRLNENIMQEGKSLAPDGSQRERRTGRTTKGMLYAIAEFMTGTYDAFYVTGSNADYTRELAKQAKDMHERINLSRALPVRVLMPDDLDARYNYKRERSYVYIDHSYYERYGRRL